MFFCNTGAEAVDGAIKLARTVTGRPGIIAFRRGFHGRTLAPTSLTTAKGKYREGYEPLLGGVHDRALRPTADVGPRSTRSTPRRLQTRRTTPSRR